MAKYNSRFIVMLTRPEIGEGIEKTCLRIHLPEQFRDTDTRHHSIDRAHSSRIALDCYKNLVQKTSMKVGYARVSPEEQKLDLLIKNLTVAVCDRLNTVQAQSRATATESRSRFSEAMELLCAGDLLVVWKLDGVKRSIADLINLLKLFGDQGVDLRSSIDEIATTAAGGRGFHIMGAKGLIQERFTAVLASAKKRYKRLDRPLALTLAQIQHANAAMSPKQETVSGMAKILGGNCAQFNALSG